MTKDDPVTKALTDRFFDPVINAEGEEDLRTWLRQQPADEIERFLSFWNWSNFRDRETILRQELKRKRRIEKFEELGEKTVRADIAQGGYRYIGGPPEARKLAREWLAKKVREKERLERERHGSGAPASARSGGQPVTPDRTADWIAWIRGLPVFAVFIFIGTVVIALGAFTEAITSVIEAVGSAWAGIAELLE